jgi:hypothetical protein
MELISRLLIRHSPGDPPAMAEFANIVSNEPDDVAPSTLWL